MSNVVRFAHHAAQSRGASGQGGLAPLLACFAHHRRRRGVDRDDHVQLTGDGLDHRRHALQLLQRRNRSRTWPGRFAADVEDVRALFDQSQPVRDGRLDRGQPPAVREAVRRDVDDAHDAGGRQIDSEAGGQPVHGAPWER